MRSATRCVFAATMLLIGSTAGFAQPQPAAGPVRSPSFSPYLNLLSRGANPAVNYFGIIRPGQQLAQQQTALQQQLAQTNQTLNSATGAANEQLVTGRGATFGFYSHYFNNSPSRGGGLGGGGGSRVSGGFAGGGGAMTAFSRPNVNVGQAPQGGNRPAARGVGGVRR